MSFLTRSGGLGSIPSPPGNALHIGGLQVRGYGLMIALGALMAIWLAQRRWQDRGGDPADIGAIAKWAIPAGLLGARAYHVATDPGRFRGRWLDVFAIWEGGLGIPGGLLAGVIAGLVVIRRRGLPAATILDVAAPAIPIAQAIGRFGNWFNQELFGRPSDLPWAVRIDPAHRPGGLEHIATYQPTFLYEALWNLALAGLLIYLGRRARLLPGELFTGYLGGYALGRLWVEALRIDPANRILGRRLNTWTSLLVLAAAVAVLLVRRLRGDAAPSPERVQCPPFID
jgi:prolipoprotein diacylglyceryl transferase